jgi:5-methylcytosine-specific restriction endonuclease McrA
LVSNDFSTGCLAHTGIGRSGSPKVVGASIALPSVAIVTTQPLPRKKKQRMKRWRDANTEHRQAYYLETREQQLQYGRQHRLQNIEREREVKSRWRKLNPDKRCAYENRRRAGKAHPPWADRDAIAAFYAACPRSMVVDHIVPLKGKTMDGYPISGLHVLWNLEYLPAQENSRKHNRMRAEDHAIAESQSIAAPYAAEP